MLNLHFKAIFQAKNVYFKEKDAQFFSFPILIYVYNLLNINNKNKVYKLSMLKHA